MGILTCEVCGGGIDDSEEVVQLKHGKYNRSTGWFSGPRIIGRVFTAVVHRSCLPGFKDDDGGRELRRIIEYLADNDSSSNSDKGDSDK